LKECVKILQATNHVGKEQFTIALAGLRLPPRRLELWVVSPNPGWVLDGSFKKKAINCSLGIRFLDHPGAYLAF
jgi:hypothetical protein